MLEPDPDLLARASALSRQAGRPDAVALDPLAGGKNNRVFLVRTADGGLSVLKSYFADPRDPRDRLGAEWAFIAYAWARGVRNLPEPLARDDGRRLGLYGFLPGRRAAAVDASHVAAALRFVLDVNSVPRDPMAVAPGSEACFSLVQHVATVERRIARLADLDPEAPLRTEAARLVSDRLTPLWIDVRDRIRRSGGSAYESELPAADLIVSPSDFGFHNALVDGDRVGFIDFEYAGRDDPAKLVCDVFCQPEVPVPIGHFGGFVDGMLGGLGLSRAHAERCALLLDLYRIKWACIILNPFLPVGAARRAFAQSASWREHCAGQFARAETRLAAIGT